MKCPIVSAHTMAEIATGVFQCAHCGFGPSQAGYRPFWAISDVSYVGGTVYALCVKYLDNLDCYSVDEITWETDEDGEVVTGTLQEEEGVLLSTKEETARFALPVTIRAKGKWDYPPAKPKLFDGMFPNPLGLKEISLKSST